MQNKAIRALLAAVINRAIADIKEIGPEVRRADPDRAMAFILSDTCEAWCLELCIDYEVIKERAAILYRRILEKEPPIKRPRMPQNKLRHIQTRHSPGERRIATGR